MEGSPGDQVDMIFKEFNKSDSPGCAVAVIKDGRIVHKNGYGMADLERGTKITPATVFHAASLTKQFTAMSIMLLVKSGDLQLSDRVDKHISVPIATKHNMKIVEILSHISGIRDQWVLLTLAGKLLYHDVITQADVLNLVSRMETPDFEPGADILYCNTGFTLASAIVKKKTGKSLSEFSRENIFEPLGMYETLIMERHDQLVQNRALGYTDKPFRQCMPNLDVTGPTNLQTTVEDLARWDRNFDVKTVGGDTALAPMQMPALLTKGAHHGLPAMLFKDDGGNEVHYGLGLMLTTYRGLNVVEHDGRDAGFRSHLIRFPDQHFAVACLCNLALPETNLPRALVRKVADIYLHDQLGPAPPGQQPAGPPINLTSGATATELEKFTGRYRSKEIDATYQVVRQGSSLVIKRDNYKDTTLEPGSVPAGLFSFKDFDLPAKDVDVGRSIRSGVVQFTPVHGAINGFNITGDRFGLRRIDQFPFTKLP